MPTAEAQAKPKETWRDWAGPYAPEPDPLLSRDEVLDRLRQIRVEATERDLRFWEAKGVLPRPVRQMHRSAIRAVYPWWYPHLVWEVRRLQQFGQSLPEIA